MLTALTSLPSARSPGVRHTSFAAQPLGLPLWDYACLLGFGLYGNLTPPARPDQVSVRRLACFATPLPSSQPHGFRLAVHYAWRQVPATGLPPARSAPCPAHHKRGTAWQCLCFVMSDLADTASPSFCFVQIRLHRIGRCRKDGAVSAGNGAGESGPAELGGPCAESANQILGTPFRREEIVYASGQSVIHSLRAASTAGVYSSE